ncbi:MAG: hypothetical protein MI974_17365 [Chitinophagales bacterium]|nr:hypothetical protein [Chitinophagales bacterium]
MKGKKFYEVLKNLKRSEHKNLKTFLKLPGHDLSVENTRLFLKLLDKVKEKRNLKLEGLHNFFQKEEVKKEQYVYNLFLRILQKYYLMTQIFSHKLLSNHILLSYFIKQNLHKNAAGSYTAGLKMLEKTNGIHDGKSSLYRFFLYELKLLKDRKIRKSQEALFLMEGALDDFYLENKLRCFCERSNRHHIISHASIDEVEHFFQLMASKIQESKSIGVQVYYNIYLMLNSKSNEGYFQKASDLIHANEYRFTNDYLKEVYDYLLNFCIRKVNANSLEYGKTYLKLVSYLEQKEILLDGKEINPSRFKNCITIYFLEEQYIEAEYFLEKYADFLEGKRESNEYKLNKALLYFCLKKYDESYSLIMNYDGKDVFYNIAFKKLLSRIYYHYSQADPNYVQLFDNLIETNKKYLKNNSKLGEKYKQRCHVFFDTLYKVSRDKFIDWLEIKDILPVNDYLWLQKIERD